MLSVIIPTCNRNDMLALCLSCLTYEKQNLNSLDYEIIVTDDSLNDNARSLIESTYPFARWVSGPKRGPAANRNNGAKYANGDIFIFIDDDCLPQSGLLSEYLSIYANTDYGAVEGKIIADRERRRYDEESPLNENGDCFWSCNISVRRVIFEQLKGFDEGFPFPAQEDNDFYIRLKTITKTYFASKAIVIHPFRIVKPFNSYNKWIKSNVYILNKYTPERGLKFRVLRIKIFLSFLIEDFQLLVKYKFNGSLFYIERCLFYFLMIFV